MAHEQTEEFARALRDLRANDPDLTCLDVDLPWVKDDEECPFASALHSNSTLRTLVIQPNICYKQLVAVFRALRVNFTLRVLDLGGSWIYDEEVVSELAGALKINSALKTLSLAYTLFSSGGARLLAGGLRENFALRTLDLDKNSIGDGGASALAGALRVNSTLRTIHLSFNSIGREGACELADAMRSNSALRILNLGGNNIGDDGARALSGALRINTTLRELHLNDMPLSETGLRPLADALRLNSTLLTLDGPTLLYLDGDAEMGEILDHLRRNVHNARVRATPLKILCWEVLCASRDQQEIDEYVPAVMRDNSRRLRSRIFLDLS